MRRNFKLSKLFRIFRDKLIFVVHNILLRSNFVSDDKNLNQLLINLFILTTVLSILLIDNSPKGTLYSSVYMY